MRIAVPARILHLRTPQAKQRLLPALLFPRGPWLEFDEACKLF